MTNSPLRLPDFIGVGPPRTATTWLHETLCGHVGLPKSVKETDFFVWQYQRGLPWYAAQFPDCPPERPMGEFSPNYFVGSETRERIARHIPHCKIICTFRNPVERTYSHYRKMCEGAYFSGTFEECLKKRPDVLEWCRYAHHLKAWRQTFGKENVLVLIQDDLKTNPQGFIRRVCEFIHSPIIKLDNSRAPRMVNSIPNQPRNPQLARVARIARDYLQRRGCHTAVEFLKRTGLRGFLFSGGAPFQPISPKTAARLRRMFLPEIEALEGMLGRDLSMWKGVSKRSGEPSPESGVGLGNTNR